MPRNIRIVGFTGMKRQDSYNKAILQSARELLPEYADLEIVSVDDLPTFEQTASIPESVSQFREKLQQADAVLIASPEYKGLLPNGTKNALAWALHAEDTSVLTGKPTALMGVGRQSATEQQHLRQLLAEKQVPVLTAPALYVSAQEKFDRDGSLAHEETEQQIRTLLTVLVMHARDARATLVS
ncbi:MAG TPA: NAD(P)H-dependent oxidoreductase [Ktedonobacteraceae bacterium]|jgi:chromate reductase